MIVKYRSISIVSLLILVFCIFSAYDTASGDSVDEHYQKGRMYYRKGDYKRAEIEFKKARSLIPEKKAAPENVDLTKTREVTVIKGEGVKEYYIEVDDVLNISVWRISELSQSEVIVRPDGKISFPLIGDVEAAGRSLTQLDDIITEKLKAYVKDPQVSIMIKSFGGRKVIILGEVRSPGVYSYTGDIRLIELIGLAGDFTRHAVSKNVLIIRGGRENPQPMLVNAYNIVKRADLSNNVLLEPQDIIYVPRSFIGNMNNFLTSLNPTLSTLYDGTVTYDVLRDMLEGAE